MSYTFASGAINAKSASLFTENQYLTLLKTDKSEYLKVLRDFGYGFDHVSYYLDEVIANEQVKTKTELLQIVPNPQIIKLWYLKYDLINIKVVLKSYLFTKNNDETFEKAGTISIHELKEALINQNFDKVSDINQELLKRLSHLSKERTASSQMISSMCDQIVYSYLLEETKKFNDETLLTYFKSLIDARNLITLFRAQRIKLSDSELMSFLIDGGNVQVSVFKSTFNERIDDQKELLKLHYSNDIILALDSLIENNNLTDLEQALNQDILSKIKIFQYDTFTSGPLINYLLMKEYEISNVRRLYFDKQIEVHALLHY